MSFHTRLAFVEHCSHGQRCTGQKRSRHPHRYQLSRIPLKGDLGVALEDMVATSDSSAGSTSVGQVIPIANFDTTSTFEPVVFEPVLNVPALITFLFITTIFSALIIRTNQVEDAVQTRKRMQEEVRSMKLKEMSEGMVSPEQKQQTLQLYEDAVRQEENLRNILPGVRIVPPSASDRKEEEARAIAKEYLGQDFNIGVPKRYNEKRDDEGGVSSVAIGVLAVVALSQVGLLFFFNFGADPMSGNDTFM